MKNITILIERPTWNKWKDCSNASPSVKKAGIQGRCRWEYILDLSRNKYKLQQRATKIYSSKPVSHLMFIVDQLHTVMEWFGAYFRIFCHDFALWYFESQKWMVSWSRAAVILGRAFLGSCKTSPSSHTRKHIDCIGSTCKQMSAIYKDLTYLNESTKRKRLVSSSKYPLNTLVIFFMQKNPKHMHIGHHF